MENRYHDLMTDRDFEYLHIERPRSLKSKADEKLMLQYFISKFYTSINAIREKCGYEARQKTLYVMAGLINLAGRMRMTYDQLESEMTYAIIDCAGWAATENMEAV